MKKCLQSAAGFVLLLFLATTLKADQSLTTLDYKVVGNYLKVSPATVAVPKGVAGSVMVQLVNADGSAKVPDNSIAENAYVEATLRGPSFPARRIVGQLNQALQLPMLNLVGEYQLDNIRLVDATTGAVRMEGMPSSVPVNVFAELLVSTVTSRPLSMDEIQEKGIAIDESNFRAVEFEVGFVLDGQTYPIKFPVVTPDFKNSTEIIPAAELEKRLQTAQQINDQLTSRENVPLPPELEAAGLNLVVKGCNFELAEPQEPRLRLSIPPIPALMVIPGNIGYLNQFFSVQIFTENAAPLGSGLSVLNLQAKLVLPPGADQVPAPDYDHPGDDPLRFARTGPNKIIQPTQTIVRPGADGVVGTADDILRIYPHESGQAEFLVEGLREGLHVMNLELTGELDGLAAGLVKIKGAAAGSVLVRNPKFSLTFSHPRTVRTGEPYDAFVTVLNTSQVEANLVSVSLPKGSVSGATLLSDERVELGTIKPGQSVTAKYRLRAERTGQIRFSNLTTGDDSVTGRFRLTMGVDERGVELSPDSIGFPDYVDQLPAGLQYAANRVLGQALSVYSAPVLPPGVKRIPWSTIQTHVLELAEAGQRVAYGESLGRVMPDLMLDWQGGRAFNEGFDQIISATEAGQQWRDAIFTATETADSLNATARLEQRARDLAGRGEAWFIASANTSGAAPRIKSGDNVVNLDRADLAQSGGYSGTNGNWLIAKPTDGSVRWEINQPIAQAELAVLKLNTNGTGEQIRWTVSNPPVGSCLRYSIGDASNVLKLDNTCNGSIDQTIPGTVTAISELPPQLLLVRQLPEINSVRPKPSCYAAAAWNYGTVLGVLFSKPMLKTNVEVASAYALDNGISAGGVRIQPGGRVAILSMKQGSGGVHPRTLTVNGVADPRGNLIVSNSLPVSNPISEGVAVNGRVFRADGSPAAHIPVTLTINDLYKDPFDRCEQNIASISQVFSDDEGRFTFDFVLAGVPYTISATDTGGLDQEAINVILNSYRGGYFDRDRLLLQAAQSNIVATLGATNLTQAVATAESLDRAIWTDRINYSEGMQGKEIAVALRFRGRATVSGRVISADGVTPAAQAAVNLFPDAASRELGRGVFADNNGRFQFNGVPLGQFTIQVKTGQGQFRTVAGVLTQVGEAQDLVIQLTAPTVEETVRSTIRGIVTEADNQTPHERAQVFVRGEKGVVGIAQSDDSGYWEVSDIPVGVYQVIAISEDGRRKGERTGVSVAANAVNYVGIALPGTSVVVGRVENSSGQPVANALVAGGSALVRTDSNGLFTLTGVPTGQRKISAGLEAQYAPQNFPRLGSASLEVLPGVTNFVVVRLNPAGVIAGQVRDAKGFPVGNINVSIPAEKGFYWTKANENGFFKFINMPPGKYIVSAPAPPVQKPVDELIDQLDTASDDEILAAVTDAFALWAGVPTTSTNVNPGSWGYTKTEVLADGDTAAADVRYFPVGSIGGIVLNDQAIPIGARVRLTGLGRLENGAPAMVVCGDRDSDAASGEFFFQNAAMVGDWGIQVASPFYTVVLSTSGRTTDLEPSVTNLVMQFPPRGDTHGRLTGRVVYPDGAVVPNAEVTTYFGPGIVNTTDTNGFFDNQIAIPAGGYSVEALDPATGFRGKVSASVVAGRTNFVEVPLLGLGDLKLNVFLANGQPASGAFVKLDGGIFRETRDGQTDTNGVFESSNLVPGWYSLWARYTIGSTTLEKRIGLMVTNAQLVVGNLTLGGVGTVTGTFRHLSDGSPISGGRVAIGSVANVPTDANGVFFAGGIPLGTYRIVATEPVSGRAAVANVTISAVDQVLVVNLVEQPQGQIAGQVFQDGKSGPIAGAEVVLEPRDGLSSRRSVTTGPDGGFTFPGVTPGSYTLTARIEGFNRSAFQVVTYPDNAPNLTINLTLPAPDPVGQLLVRVLQPDGVTPAAGIHVLASAIGGSNKDSDTNGYAFFDGLKIGSVFVRATSPLPSETFNWGITNFALTASVPSNSVSVRLAGVGTVSGQIFDSSGLVPVPFATLSVEFLDDPFRGQKRGNLVSDDQGRFTIGNIPVGSYRLIAESQSLSASTNGVIASHHQTNDVRLTLAPSGVIMGRVVRADGSAAVPTNNVVLKFNSQSSAAGISVVLTDFDGHFGFTNVPLGTFTLDVSALKFNGLIKRSGILATNGQVLDLGDLRLDEDYPVVTNLNPIATATGVPINTTVEITFNEPLLAATVNNNTNGFYLRGPTNLVRATVVLTNHPDDGKPRVVRITPLQPLRSLTTYELAIISGERRDAVGQLIATGPTDLVGRSTPQLFLSSFTTRDDDPPLLVSIFPTNGAVQVDPAAVMRLTFNEALRSTNIYFALTGPNGLIPGVGNLSADGRILAFAPNSPLQPIRSYTMIVSNLIDVAGNRFAAEPFTATFSTLDTLGPTIATLKLNGSPVAGTAVPVEAILSSPEAGATVRFFKELEPTAFAAHAPYIGNILLPTNGTVRLQAIATDQFGNDGELVQIEVTVVSNAAPTITLTKLDNTNGIVGTSKTLSFALSASDDNAVTNVTLVGLGAVQTVRTFSNGNKTNLTFTVATNSLAGSLLQFRAQATDSSGEKSAEAVLDYTVTDATKPNVVIVNPVSSQILDPSQPLDVLVALADNSSNVTVKAQMTGLVSDTVNTNFVLVPNTWQTNAIRFWITNAVQNGGSAQVTLTVTDSTTNSTAVAVSFKVPDITAPRLTSTVPTNGATAVSLWDDVTWNFSENIRSSMALTNLALLTNNFGDVLSYSVDTLFSSVRIRPQTALRPGAVFTNILYSGVTDVATNAAVDTNGLSIPAEGWRVEFRTAAILSQWPTNNTRLVAGQKFVANVGYEKGMKATYFGFRFGTNALTSINVNQNTTNVAVQLSAPTNATAVPFNVLIANSSFFSGSWTQAPIWLEIRSRDLDDDGDGWSNGFEADRGMNAFVADADADDFDHDGLTNGQERELGTDPGRADTDNDGLNDGAEIALGTDPLSPDTDGDGLLDGVDPLPLAPSAGINFAVASNITLTEGELTNLTFTVTSSNAPLTTVNFGGTNTPVFATMGAVTFTNTTTNGFAVGQVTLKPLLLDAGTYQLTLKATGITGSNAVSGFTNITVTVLDNPSFPVTRWKDAVSGNFSDTNRWTDGVPTVSKPGVIDTNGTYTVTFNTDATVGELVFGATTGTQTFKLVRALTISGSVQVRGGGVLSLEPNGSIQGAGLLNVASQMNWSAGSMSGNGITTIASGGQLLLTGTDWKYLTTRTLNNAGTLTFATTSGMTIGSGATVNNSGVIEIQNDMQVQNAVGGFGTSSTVNNSGIIRKTAGIGTFLLGTTLNNDGTITIQSGSLEAGVGGVSSGAFNVASGSSMRFSGITHTLGSTARIQGAGSLMFPGGTTTINGTVEVEGNVDATGGVAIFAPDAKVSPINAANISSASSSRLEFNTGQEITIGSLTSAGTLRGSDQVTVTNAFVWTQGTLDGSGSTVVSSNATLEISGGQYKWLIQRTLRNEGVGTWSGNTGMTIGANALFDNAGALDIQTNVSVNNAISGTATTFRMYNSGVIRKTGGAGSFSIDGSLNNSGMLSVESGTFDANLGGNSSGSFVVTNGTTMRFGGAHVLTATARIEGSGGVTFLNGAVSNAGVFNVSGPVTATSGAGVFTAGAQVAPINQAFITGNSGRLEFNSGSEILIGSLTQAGILRGSDIVTITTNLTWTQSNMDGSGVTRITTNATLAISGNSSKSVIQRTLINEGSAVWSGSGALGVAGNGEFRNVGLFEIQNDLTTFTSIGGTASVGYFSNLGRIVKTSGTGTTEINQLFRNDGLVEVQSGTFRMNFSATNSGSYLAATNATLYFVSGSHVMNGASSISGAGRLLLGSGTLEINGAFDIPTEVTGGSILFNGVRSAMTNRFLFNGGTIGGSGDLTIAGNFEWQSGTMSGTGRTVAANGAKILVTPGSNHFLNRQFVNRGLFTVTNGASLFFGNGTLRNEVDGVVEIPDAGSFGWNTGTSLVENLGTLNKNGAGAFTIGVNLPFNNSGVLNINNGNAAINGSGQNTGTINVAAGTSLSFGTSFTHASGSTLGGVGTITFNNGTHDLLGSFLPQNTVSFVSGTETIRNVMPGSVNVNIGGATVRVNVSQSIRSLIIANAGSLEGSGDVTVTNSLVWARGFMAGTGKTIVPVGVTVTLNDGIGAKYLQRQFDNSGTISVLENTTIYCSGGTLNNFAGATLEIPDGLTFTLNGPASVLNNQGTINMSGTNALKIGVTLNNAGTIDAQSGTFQINSAGTNIGSILISTNATAVFNATLTHIPDSYIGGAGEMRFLAGTHNLLGTFEPLGVLSFRGGTVTLNAPIEPKSPLLITNSAIVNFNATQTFDTLLFSGSALGGSGNLTITNSFVWSAGTMTGAGQTLVAAGATATMGGGSAKTLSRIFENDGTLNFGTDRIFFQNGTLNNAGVFNAVGGDLRLISGTTNRLINSGTWNKTGTNLFELLSLVLNNSGTVNVDDGSFHLNSGVTNSGAWNIATNATVTMDGSSARYVLTSGTSFSGSGNLVFDGSSIIQLETNVDFGSLQVIFRNSGGIVGVFEIANGLDGSILFDRSMTGPGSLRIAGTLATSGPTITVTINGDLTLANGSKVNNPGQIQVNGIYLDQGAAIIGNPPVKIGGIPATPLMLVSVKPATVAAISGIGNSAPAVSQVEVQLSWRSQPGARFTVEYTEDLQHWTVASSVVTEVTPGEFEARVQVPVSARSFFRTRRE